jgi:hypothetical protein
LKQKKRRRKRRIRRKGKRTNRIRMAAYIYKHFVGSPSKAKQSIGSFPYHLSNAVKSRPTSESIPEPLKPFECTYDDKKQHGSNTCMNDSYGVLLSYGV